RNREASVTTHVLGAQCFQPACIAGKHFGKPSSELLRLAAWKDCAPRPPFHRRPNGALSLTVVPAPLFEITSSLPPSLNARWRMLVKPLPSLSCSGSNP